MFHLMLVYEFYDHSCFNICKFPDEYPGKTNYCFKRKYKQQCFSKLRDLSQLKLSTHYTTNVKSCDENINLEHLQQFFCRYGLLL